MKAVVLSVLLLLASPLAHAGYVEVGASGNVKSVNLSDDVTDRAVAITGSVSYMFDMMSALEFSYTNGSEKTVVRYPSVEDVTTTINYSMLGLDFILTLGEAEAVLRPYVKLGVGYILNKERRVVHSFNVAEDTVDSEGSHAFVPSGGFGFRFKVSQQLSIKAGIDAWTSKSITADNVKVDYSGRVGLSWMF